MGPALDNDDDDDDGKRKKLMWRVGLLYHVALQQSVCMSENLYPTRLKQKKSQSRRVLKQTETSAVPV